MPNCIVCKETGKKLVFKEFEIDMVRCISCGHVYSTYEADPNFDGYFHDTPLDNEEGHFWWNEAHNKMYKDFARRYLEGKSGKMLDVGAGLGYFVKFASDYNGWEVFGSEISPQGVQFAKEKLGLENMICGLVQDAPFEENTFDLIVLWDVIEHIPDPAPLLTHLHKILKPGGTIFMHTPNIQMQLPKAKLKRLLKGMNPDIHYLEAKDHLNIYSMPTLKRVIQNNGFTGVKFLHLPPIQGVAGNNNPLSKLAKNLWYLGSKFLFYLTLGTVNFDNLFVEAKKTS